MSSEPIASEIMNVRSDLEPVLARFLEEAAAREEDIQLLLGEIREAVNALVTRLPSPPPAITAASSAPSVAARHADYKDLIVRIRHAVRQAAPVGAIIAVVSKGDPELLQLDGRRGWHFPQNAKGEYAGFHPVDSAAAITHLEEVCARGAEYLLIPQTALWWLEHYRGFRQHLESRYAFVIRQPDTCALVRLSSGSGGTQPPNAPERPHGELEQLRAVVGSILPDDARLLVISKGDEALLKFDKRETRHFPCTEKGSNAGHHPADSDEAIARLREQIALGWEYLLVPAASAWWLEFYDSFTRHLYTSHHLVARQRHVAFIFELSPSTEPPQTS